jgi:putative modified peptide
VATDQQMDELLERMIADDEFREQLMTDPRAATENAGYQLTDEQLAQFETQETGELNAAVDERVSKMVPFGRRLGWKTVPQTGRSARRRPTD